MSKFPQNHIEKVSSSEILQKNYFKVTLIFQEEVVSKLENESQQKIPALTLQLISQI